MIFTEKVKTKVVFSNLFYLHYTELYQQLSDIMWNYHKGYGTFNNTKDYWVRNFMPIQVEEEVFVKFIYNPDYLVIP